MGTIVSYPRPSRILDGSEAVPIFQDGFQVSSTVADVAALGGTAAVAQAKAAIAPLAASAQMAANTALAVGNYFATQAAGEAGTPIGKFFSMPDGLGGLVYRQNNAGGSVVIGAGATVAQLTALQASLSRNINLDRVGGPTNGANAAVGPAGNLNGLTYYRVSFRTVDGETEAGPATGAIAPAGNQVSLTNIPVSANPRVVARAIYRMPVGETDSVYCRLVGVINDNVTTTFTDNVGDAGLGGYCPWSNGTGGNVTVAGVPLLTSGFSVAFGPGAMPSGANYASSAFGPNALAAAIHVIRSEAVGTDAALALQRGQGITAIGTHAVGDLVNGSFFVGIGYGAFQHVTAGGGGVAVGVGAMNSMQSSDDNTAIGLYAMQLPTGGTGNTALGSYAGYAGSTGSGNTLIGTRAGQNYGAGNFNTLVGDSAGSSITGSTNTGLGFSCLSSCTTGGGNAALGTNAGASVTTGGGNVFVGENAGNNANQKKDAQFSAAFGYNAFNTRDGEIVIGNPDLTNYVVLAGVSFNKAQLAKLLQLASA